MEIKKRIEEIVYPQEGKEHPERHELSELDQLVGPDMAVPVLFFFKEPACETACNIGEVLKVSLSKLLGTFYPLAGRAVERAAGQGRRFDIDCGDQGAIFCEAWADFPLSALGAALHPCPPLLFPRPLSFAPLALLHVQVTHFTCGGFCLCLQNNRILCDGASFYYFMKSWVEIINGEASLTFEPYFNSSLLGGGQKLAKSLPSMEYHQHFNTSMSMKSKPFCVSKFFPFTPDFIASLKEGVKLSHHPSSFECIVAYLWRNVTLARKLAPDEETRLCYLVNARDRLEPPLPRGYFGNAVFTAFAYAKVEDLLTKPLSYAMNLIREATSSMSSDYLKAAMDWLNAQESPPSLSTTSEQSLSGNSWSSFGVYEMNFPWGKPHVLRTIIDPNVNGEFVTVFPSPLGKGHVDVLVGLNSEYMDAFEALIAPRA